jgi:ceramide synthetase
MVVIKRGTERKYHEFLLHHCVAVSLIILSMLSNETAVGAVVLITHDLSDILAAFSRGFVETKY